MNVYLDKTNNSLITTEIPIEANKMKLSVAEFNKEGVPDVGQGKWVVTATVLLQATLSAIKVEEVTTNAPELDVEGVQIVIDGVPQYSPQIETVETVLETKVVDLKVL